MGVFDLLFCIFMYSTVVLVSFAVVIQHRNLLPCHSAWSFERLWCNGFEKTLHISLCHFFSMFNRFLLQHFVLFFLVGFPKLQLEEADWRAAAYNAGGGQGKYCDGCYQAPSDYLQIGKYLVLHIIYTNNAYNQSLSSVNMGSVLRPISTNFNN